MHFTSLWRWGQDLAFCSFSHGDRLILNWNQIFPRILLFGVTFKNIWSFMMAFFDLGSFWGERLSKGFFRWLYPLLRDCKIVTLIWLDKVHWLHWHRQEHVPVKEREGSNMCRVSRKQHIQASTNCTNCWHCCWHQNVFQEHSCYRLSGSDFFQSQITKFWHALGLIQ